MTRKHENRFRRMADMEPHFPAVCIRDVKSSLPIGKGWKSLFRCPACRASTWQALNFLSGYSLWCDGQKFAKEKKRGVRLRPYWP